VERRLIRTKAPHGLYGFRAGQRYFVLNVLEELDRPGEYAVDATSGILYVWPPAPLAGAEVIASELAEPLVRLRDARHVTLQGFVLEGARGRGVEIHGGEGVTIDGCVLRNLGTQGVLVRGGTRHTVRGCELHDLGDGGISMEGGDRATLVPGAHAVVGNHIHRIGQWSRCYQPAVSLSGVGHRVAHNRIHDGPHSAVILHGNEHLVEFNEVFRMCLETGDAGAFYLGRDWTQRGNVFRHNYIHHMGGVGMGSMAVYLDDCTSGTTIFGNVFYKVSRAAFIGGGRDNSVENNLFIDCAPAVEIDGRGLDPSPVWHGMVFDTMRKSLDRMKPDQPPYRDRYPALAALAPYYAEGKGVPPEGNKVLRNVVSGGKWLSVHWHAKPEWVEVKDNLTEGDPGFVDAASEDFRLREDSPAWKLGFRRIPMEKIGSEGE
jgi:hypothetical protein